MNFLNSAGVISALIWGVLTFGILMVTLCPLFCLACFIMAMASPITVTPISFSKSLVRSAASLIRFVTKVAAYLSDSSAGIPASAKNVTHCALETVECAMLE